MISNLPQSSNLVRFHFILFVFACLFLAASVSSATESEAVAHEPVSIAPRTVPVKFDNVIETVIIGSERFQVPEPWTGNRLFPTTRNLDELKKIPEDSTYNNSEIFILKEAYEPLLSMLEQARLDGVELTVESAYRSINYQTRIFLRMLEQGRSFEDIIRYVAPPGYSQHMLGTAMDFYPSNWEFAETEQYRWLQENGPRFGFEETYSRINRFMMPWEAWHWNYVGVPDDIEVTGTVADERSDSEDTETEFTN